MRYWKTYQKPLIHELLTTAKDSECDFILWQQYGSSRKIYDIELRELDPSRMQFFIKNSSLKKYGDLMADKPVYFHVKSIDIIFKKDKYKFYGNIFDSTQPNELQVYEKRKHQRFYYKYQDHKNITFESTTKKENGEPEFLLSCVLVDISISGASMVINMQSKHRLTEGMDLNLMNLTDQALPEPLKTKVVYMERYKGAPDDILFKVGLKFSSELDTVSYKSINSVIEKKATRVKGLDPERYCGLDPEDQYRIINNIEVKNKILANNLRDSIEYLDRLRYMTTQMKIELLQDLSHDLLATALRLSSKELIYDLFIELSENVRVEFLERLEREKPPTAISKAQNEIIKYLKQKEASGELVLDPRAFTTYV
ncbi:MAG: hypothetical protein CME64_11840 [Halobacteriovoraceae bacterium]|nr:hypothetical protein [Halobacteriovoraceae bacterium]|tara:strand:- start:114622 stop:115728 length:1107 start_codon:yes stop_codon:yes gene_type:complete